MKALEVDLAGLRLLVERRGKAFALMELCQNAWDENGVSRVDITTEVLGHGKVVLTIEDDAPEGFCELSHAYTLYAPSAKKADPTKRGRFNLGEKLVIALADRFTVETTTGGVAIDVKKNTRTRLRSKRDTGSRITALLRMSRDELKDALDRFMTLIPPPDLPTFVNGQPLPVREPLARFRATLQSEIADAAGFLRPTRRLTMVEVYEPLPGETGALYEMGIPVVDTGDSFHVNVMQKVPLNADRDNVPPAFLQDVRAHVLNAMASQLSEDAAAETWVNNALEDEQVTDEAVDAVLTKRFGTRRVTYDPSDLEANRIALSQDYAVVHSRALSPRAWKTVRRARGALPAGQVTPSPKPFRPGGAPLKLIEPSKYTLAQRRFVFAVQRLHEDLVGRPIVVALTTDRGWQFRGTYSGDVVFFNVARIRPLIEDEETMSVVLHEFAHSCGQHLTHEFDQGIGRMAARLVCKVIENPDYIRKIQAANAVEEVSV
jgi:hypothetical protein